LSAAAQQQRAGSRRAAREFFHGDGEEILPSRLILWQGKERRLLSEQILKDIALLAREHLVLFADILGAIAEGAADIPAHMAAVEFPGRAIFLLGTVLPFPAGNHPLFFSLLVDQKKIDIFFNMFRDIAPSLFVAVHGANGNAEKIRQLLLGFAKLATGKIKFVVGHGLPRLRRGLWVIASKACSVTLSNVDQKGSLLWNFHENQGGGKDVVERCGQRAEDIPNPDGGYTKGAATTSAKAVAAIINAGFSRDTCRPYSP
jgi:hypothetical protein